MRCKTTLVAALFCAMATLASAQISPGPLSKAHSSLNGTTNCTSCHKLGGQATLKCLECHTEIASRISAGRGFHARVVQKSSGSQGCATCHSEHNGENFSLIRWEPSKEKFDHSRTGWTLEGKHASVACNQCHSAQHVSAAERSSIRMKDLSRTFLGRSTTCSSCHSDVHQGRLGPNCAQCHNANDWKIAASTFDHSKTRFALTGAHMQVGCNQCHSAGSDGKPRWSGLAFDRCADCHSDPHHGKFAASCESCHSTRSWHSISTATVKSTFNHSKTEYPLLGMHAQVSCTSCHRSGDFSKRIAFSQCSDCHNPDPHGGQFAKRADRGECSSCHTVAGFKPANFGIKEHALTAYPLLGKHAAVSCANCHVPKGTATLYKVKFDQCLDCHRDVHVGQFQSAPHLNHCQDCHTVQGFRPSTFTLAAHKRTSFQLTGAHLAVPCSDCHKSGLSARYADAAQFRFEDRSCVACHRDPHKGQFRERMARFATTSGRSGCEACHSVTVWNDLSKFDHASTKFALLGSHRAVACMDCHKPPNLETTMVNVEFHSAPSACEQCHTDVHGGQFIAENGITHCASCHNSNKWRPSLFDHDTRTSFALQGAHKNVSCGGCHKSFRAVGEKQVLYYKPTPKECSACHGADVKKLSALAAPARSEPHHQCMFSSEAGKICSVRNPIPQEVSTFRGQAAVLPL